MIRTNQETSPQYSEFAEAGWYQEANRALADLLPYRPEASHVVDAGCGSGASSTLLLEKYPHAHILGIDQSDDMLNDARESAAAHSRLAFVKGDVTNLVALAPHSDVIAGFNMIHYLDDANKQKFVAEAATSLPSGGVLALNTGFFEGAKPQETEFFYGKFAMELWSAVANRVDETLLPRVKRGLKRKDPPPSFYEKILKETGFRLLSLEQKMRNISVESIRSFFRTKEVSSILLSCLEPTTANEALAEAIDKSTENVPAEASMPRNWLYIVAEKI